jgi:hypothetical protein
MTARTVPDLATNDGCSWRTDTSKQSVARHDASAGPSTWIAGQFSLAVMTWSSQRCAQSVETQRKRATPGNGERFVIDEAPDSPGLRLDCWTMSDGDSPGEAIARYGPLPALTLVVAFVPRQKG